jgi:hypothetical protein
VEPGEAVFVLTRERLDLPSNIIAVLTPKRKLAHDGIIIMGGLAVDPLYRGYLLIGLYNISSTSFPLRPGRKLIGAVFYELGEDEVVADMAAPPEIKDFPDDLVKLIRDYEPVGLKALQDEILETKRDLQSLKADLTTDKEWKDTFKLAIDRHTKAVEDHDRQIGDLIKKIDKESEARESGDNTIKSKIDSLSNVFFGAKLIWIAFWAVVLLVIGALIAGPIGSFTSHLQWSSGVNNPTAGPSAPQAPQGAATGTQR